MVETVVTSVVHSQIKQTNPNIYYCLTKVLTGTKVQFKNINKNLYIYPAAVYAEGITIDPEKLKKIINYGGNVNYSSGELPQKNYTKDFPTVSVPVTQEAPTKISKTEWTTYVKVWSSYILDFGIVSTLDFFRLNSNIYKNIFNHIIFDLELIQDKKFDQLEKQVFSFEQPFYELDLYDIIYLDDNGLYKKAIANRDCYDAIGIVVNKYDGVYTVMQSGIIDNVFDFKPSMSGILYLSDTKPGKMVTYEEIDTMFYKPVAFYNDNKIVINIMDASIGDTMGSYNNNQFGVHLGHLDNYDIQAVIQEVLNNA